MLVSVVLPVFPETWATADAWELCWVSRDDSGGPIRALPGSTVALALPRYGEAAVLCKAVFGAHRSLPYGAAWPQSLGEDGCLRPDAAGGYAASLALVFYRAGRLSCPLDLGRFASEASTRLADAWDLDPATFAPIVDERRFRADHLRQPGRVT
ncbi:MAG: hypothetical protein JXM71_00035, partial [Spirochaetales bacterium]|nr:hypothetical protein [Spirochaetales bacterium]